MEVGSRRPAGTPLNRVSVTICGDEYIIKGEASPEHIRRIAQVVDQRLRELIARHRNVPFHRLAVLAAFQFADEMVRAKEENHELIELIRGS